MRLVNIKVVVLAKDVGRDSRSELMTKLFVVRAIAPNIKTAYLGYARNKAH